MYACGTFSGNMVYPGGSVAANGITDMFVVRLDTAGLVEWIRTGGGPGPDRATDLAVGEDGSVTVTGQFSGSMSVSGTNLVGNGPSQDIFLARYNAAGVFTWARAAGSPENADIGEQVSVDADGNAYVAGEYSHTAVFGGLSITSAIDPQLQAPGTDVFVAKYSTTGTPLWVQGGASPNSDEALGLAADEAGNCWLAGRFSQDITFDLPHANTLNNAGFLVKFNGDGEEQWFRRIGGGSAIRVGDLCFAGDTLWLAGSQSGNNLVFASPPVPLASAYPYSAFTAGFSQAGDLLAQRSLGSDHIIEAKAIDVRGDEVLLGGTFVCQALELSQESGGDGLFISWGTSNGWLAALQRSDLDVRYAQMIADHQSMDLRGVAFDVGQRMYGVGEYNGDLVLPTVEGHLRTLPGDSLFSVGPDGIETSCGDTTYYDAARLQTRGVLDGFLARGFIRGRDPMDIFLRNTCQLDLPLLFEVQPGIPPDCNDADHDIAFCGMGSLTAAFNYTSGPEVAVSWSTGSTFASIEVMLPGIYSATGSIGDGCFAGAGEADVAICGLPAAPGITDSQLVNEEDSVCQGLITCPPEQIELTAGPIPGIAFHWTPVPGDTVINAVSFTAPFSARWFLTVFNEVGCANQSFIDIAYLDADTLVNVTFDQQITFPQDLDGNDTIAICSFESVEAWLVGNIAVDGSSLSSNGAFQVLDTVFCNQTGYVDVGGFNLSDQFKPIVSSYFSDGWYVFTYRLSITDGPCLDNYAGATIQDSIYVEGTQAANSAVDIFGSIFICSGDTVGLMAQANGPGTFQWAAQNGGIVGSDTSTTLLLTQPGLIEVVFTPQDTGVCVAEDVDQHSVQFVPPPTIDMVPADGLVCPGTDVQLVVSGANGTYAWYGPSGPLPFLTSSILVQDPGTYFCVVSTFEGCSYATALRTVILYTTPYATVFPQPVLCEGGSVQVAVQSQSTAQITWAAPLTGSAASQTITAPGTYSCSVTQCGEVTDVSFTITLSSVSVDLLDDGPFQLCPGDSVELEATPGLVAYVWQPGNLLGAVVHASVDGAYSVIGFDQFGCTDTAGIALVDVYDFPQPMIVSADTVCEGEPSTALANGSGLITWYADAALQQVLGTGSPLSLGNLSASTIVYATQSDATCTGPPVPLELPVVQADVELDILGDTLYCQGTTLALQVDASGSFTWTTPVGGFTTAAVSVPSVTAAAIGVWTVAVDEAGCPSGVGEVHIEVLSPQVAILDTGPFVLCPMDSIQLSASPGLAFYQWSPGGANGAVVYVQAAAEYSVVGIDAYGCSDTAGTAVVNAFSFTQAVVVDDVGPVCAGDAITANATGSGQLVWYTDASLTVSLGTGNTVTLADLQQSTTVYITQTEAPCTSQPVPLVLTVIPLPPGPTIQGDTLLCDGDELNLTVPLTATANWITPLGNFTQPGVSIPNMNTALSGTYSVYYSTGNCAGPVASVGVLVEPAPDVDLGGDVEICQGESVELDGGAGAEWQWSTGSTDRTILAADGTFWVLVTGATGCTAVDTIRVTEGDCELPVTNVFSPNGDGVNDAITLTSPSSEPLRLEIYNRWGQLLFTHSARNVQWDGRNGISGELVPAGVYFYVLQAILPNGEPYGKTGYLHVIR
jgi:gliding motility-associated-like protein